MDLGLKNKVAVVTGASKGIGLAVTKALVAEGARVIAGARDVGSELRFLAEGGDVDAVSIDLATPDGPHALVAEAQKYAGLDIVVSSITAFAASITAIGACIFSASAIRSGATPNRSASASTRIAGDVAADSRSAIAAMHERSRSGSLGDSLALPL